MNINKAYKTMQITWNQFSIMKPQINTCEQSSVNQNPIAYMTNNTLFGIHKALFLVSQLHRYWQRWVRVTTTYLKTNKLLYVFKLNTVINQASQP